MNPFIQAGFFNDDAIYILTANKLWKAAETYPHLVIKPDYPLPGLPLLLAPFARLVAPHWTALDWVSIFLTLISLFVIEKFMRRWLSPGERLAVLAFYALNPVVAKFAGSVMPSAAFTFFAIASFHLLNQAVENPKPATALWLGFFMGWGSLTRPEGAVLIVSIVAALAITHQRSDILKRALIPVAAWGFFYVFWFQAQKSTITEFGGDVTALLAYWSGNFIAGLSFVLKLPQVFMLDTWWILRLAPLPKAKAITLFLVVIGVFLVAMGFRSLWRDERISRCALMAVGIFCALHYLAHVFWHVASPRYMLPTFPFLLIFAVRGMTEYFHFFRATHTMRTAVLTLLLVSYAYETGYGIYRTHNMPETVYAPPWAALEWIKHNIGPDEKITSNVAPAIELYTGRHALKGLNATNADLYLYLLMKYRIRYLVRTRGEAVAPGVGETVDPNIRWARKRRWMRLYSDRFPRVFLDSVAQTGVRRIDYNPNYVKAFEKFIEAVRAFESKKFPESFKAVNEALKIYPRLGCAYNLLGALYLFREEAAPAEIAFVKAQQLLPDSTFELLNLATLYYRKGLKDRAAECIQRGREIAELNGERAAYLEIVRDLQQKWEQGRATLFIDSPQPSAFDEDDQEDESEEEYS